MPPLAGAVSNRCELSPWKRQPAERNDHHVVVEEGGHPTQQSPDDAPGVLSLLQVLAILPLDPETAEAVVTGAVTAADGPRPLVFLYRGEQPAEAHAELLEVTDPYLRDRAAQVAFARAEARSRKVVPNRRYVYIPGDAHRAAVGDVWKALSPRETLVLDGDQDMLPPIALDRVRRTNVDGYPVLHLVTGRLKAKP